jgi:hypothetical protein
MTCHIQSLVLATAWCLVALAAAATLFFTRGLSRRVGCVSSAVVTLIVFLWISQAGPAISTAIPRSRQRETVRRMQRIAAAMKRAEVRGRTPVSIGQLASLTHSALDERDAWGNSFFFLAEQSRYVLISYGQCGQPDRANPWGYPSGETLLFGDDTVLVNGSFVRIPSGVRPE